MNKIFIITTKGCEACEIAKHNVEIALTQTSANIEVQVQDYKTVDKNIIKKYKITDYPTVLYMAGDNVIYKAVGSFPSAVYLRWIDIYFRI